MEIAALNIISILIFSALYFELIKIVTEQKVNRTRHLSATCLLWIMNTSCVFLIKDPLYKVSVISLITFAIGKLTFNKASFTRILFANIIYNAAGFLSDLIGYYMFTIFLGAYVVDVQNSFFLLLVANANFIITLNLTIFIYRYVRDKYKNVSYIDSIKAWNKYLVIALAILFVNIYLISMYSVNKERVERFILLIPITLFAVVIYAAYSQIMMRTKESQNNQLQYYLTTMSRLSNDIKQFKHDFGNVLISLYGLAEQQEWQALHSRLLELQGSNITQYASDIEAMVNIREPSLISLLAAKMYYAHQNELNFFIEAPQIINKLPIEGTDFIRIVGILIDNAIEAAMDSNKREVGAVFLRFKEYFEITVVNSIKDEQIEIAVIDKQGRSSKGIGRGTGLSSLAAILHNYQNVEWSTEIRDGEFIQCIAFRDLKENKLEQAPTQV